MKQAHERAAIQLFIERNSRDNMSRGIFDLHGLHRGEALNLVYGICVSLNIIPKTSGNGYKGAGDGSYVNYLTSKITLLPHVTYITIITGSGHHSTHQFNSSRATLANSVTEFCKEFNVKKYVHIKDHNGFVGGMKIYI